jgi:hypothetical protein
VYHDYQGTGENGYHDGLWNRRSGFDPQGS